MAACGTIVGLVVGKRCSAFGEGPGFGIGLWPTMSMLMWRQGRSDICDCELMSEAMLQMWDGVPWLRGVEANAEGGRWYNCEGEGDMFGWDVAAVVVVVVTIVAVVVFRAVVVSTADDSAWVLRRV